MNQDIINKIIRKTIIWDEIKSKEQEYKRLQEQIVQLEKAQKNIVLEIQQLIEETEQLGEFLTRGEYDALMAQLD